MGNLLANPLPHSRLAPPESLGRPQLEQFVEDETANSALDRPRRPGFEFLA